MISRVINGERRFLITGNGKDELDDGSYADASFLAPKSILAKANEMREIRKAAEATHDRIAEEYEKSDVGKAQREKRAKRLEAARRDEASQFLDPKSIYQNWNSPKSREAAATPRAAPRTEPVDQASELERIHDDAFAKWNRR